MPKTSDIQATNVDRLSILLIGEPGTGKTHFLGTLPKPLYIFDFDDGLRTLAGVEGIDYDTYRDSPYGYNGKTGEGFYDWGTGWIKFMEKLASFTKDCPYKSVAIDTGTALMELAKNRARKRNPSNVQEPDSMEKQHWGEVGNLMRSALDLLTMLRCVRAFNGHVKRDTNPLNDQVEFVILLEGQMQGKLPAFFDEVYYTNILKKKEGDKIKQSYVLQTQQSGLYKSARSRAGVPDGIESSWQAVAAAIQKPLVVAPKK